MCLEPYVKAYVSRLFLLPLPLITVHVGIEVLRVAKENTTQPRAESKVPLWLQKVSWLDRVNNACVHADGDVTPFSSHAGHGVPWPH